MTFLDLPEDILSLVFRLLDPKDFLALCRSSKILYSNYQKDPVFWRTKTSTTFRTPISPLLRADGARWYHLYRRLMTQTRLYTWGQGLKGNLGLGLGPRNGAPRALPFRPRGLPGRRGGRDVVQPPRLVFQRTTSNWPTEAHVPDEASVIADLQCGGWSTIILSSAGKLYATGSINSTNYINVGVQTDRFERLEYLTQSTSTISSFSAGRAHILALTDDDEILSWDRINARGLKVLSRYGGRLGKATRVVAGWGESSAYVPDVGLVYWQPLVNDQDDEHLDGRQVREKTIPNTARTVLKDGSAFEVIAHVVLEGILVYITSDSQIFAVGIGHSNQEDTEPERRPVPIPGYANGTDQLVDIQGSFRNFVVFTASGRVLAGNTGYLRRCFEAAQATEDDKIGQLQDVTNERPRDVPALQRTGVIALRFGDWHYHALHSNGKITSHGHEPESCGALGLGYVYNGGKLRGMMAGPVGMRQDAKLRPVADLTGRQVWFEPEKKDWLHYLQGVAEHELKQHSDLPYWNDILHEPVKQTMFSEWVEQEGRHWEDGPYGLKNLGGDSSTVADDFHLDSYFALAIGAAGWHSGALVLVDEEKAENVKQKWLSPRDDSKKPNDQKSVPGQFPQDDEHNGPKPVWTVEDFPRVKFPDGTESPLPGGAASQGQTVASALRPWRDGMPSMEELGLEAH